MSSLELQRNKKNLLPSVDYFLLSFLTRLKNGDIASAFSYFPPISFPKGFKFSSRGLKYLNSVLQNWIMTEVILKSAWQKKAYKTKEVAKICRFWELETNWSISIDLLMVLRDLQQLWYDEVYENGSYVFSRKLNGAESIFIDLIFRKILETQKKSLIDKFGPIYKNTLLSAFNFSYHSLDLTPKWDLLSKEEQMYAIASTDFYVESFKMWESSFNIKNYEIIQFEIKLVVKKLLILCDVGLSQEAWSLFLVPIEIFFAITQNGLLNKNRYLSMQSFLTLSEKEKSFVILEIRADFQRFLNKIIEVKRKLQNIGFVEDHFEIAQKILRVVSVKVNPFLESYEQQLGQMAKLGREKNES
ncbi:MAG: hypothetical protein COB02_14380 [Candidatus Cloacimonadota bacterium]|nr:MAG: hypothetical protein COB02_14380 [Candidatus Cloacimonadota bacterium]